MILPLLKGLLAGRITPSAELPWSELIGMAQRHGVLWPLQQTILCNEQLIPREEQIQLAGRLLGVERDTRILMADAGQLADAAETLGVRLFFFKGSALLLGRPYGGLEQRPLLDIDLVLRREDVDRMRPALAALGYEPYGDEAYYLRHHQHLVFLNNDKRRPRAVELHWTPFFSLFGSRSADGAAMDRAVRHVHDGRGYWVFDLEDTLLSLCLHLANHRFRGQLKWLVDIDRLVHFTAIRWPLFWERAAELGAKVACAYALELTQTLWPGVARHLQWPDVGRLDQLRLEGLRRLRAMDAYGESAQRAGLWEGIAIDQLLLDRLRDRGRQLTNKIGEVYERYGGQASGVFLRRSRF